MPRRYGSRASWSERVEQGIEWRGPVWQGGGVRTSLRSDGTVVHMHPVRNREGVEAVRWWHDASIRHPSDMGAHARHDVGNAYWTSRRADAGALSTALTNAATTSGTGRTGRVRRPRPTPTTRPPPAPSPVQEAIDRALAEVQGGDEPLRIDQRGFGIEIECLIPDTQAFIDAADRRGVCVRDEGYNHTTRSWWKLVTDGSVNSRTSGGRRYAGREVVSPPLRGEDGFRQVRAVCEALVEVGARVSRECGLHVHLEAQDLTAADAIRLIAGYTEAQASIDSLMPSSRRRGANQYCNAHPNDVRHMLEGTGRYATYYSPPMSRNLQDIASRLSNRYVNVNVQSFPRYGTIEFRQHSGSIEYTKISAWIRLVHAAIRAAREERTFGSSLPEMLTNLGLHAQDRSYFLRRATHFASRLAA